MSRIALIFLVVAAAIFNVVLTGFTQDAAYRSYEQLERDPNRYSSVGSLVVPIAAEQTVLQVIAFALPLAVGAFALRRRWDLAVSVAVIVGMELLIVSWCAMVVELARRPFLTG